MSEERLTGNYKLVVCYVKDIGEGMYIESQPSPAVGPVSVNNGWLKWTNIPVSTDPNVVKRTLYRTVSNGEIFYYLTTIDDNTTTTYEDHNFDEALGDELDENKIAPPNCDFVAEMGGVMFYIGLSSDKSKIAYSTQGYPYYVPALNRLEVGTGKDKFTGVLRAENTLLLFKANEIWALMGVDATTFTIQCLSPRIGCVNGDTLQLLSGYCFFVSNRGLEVMTTGGQFLSPTLTDDVPNIRIVTSSTSCTSAVSAERNQYWLMNPNVDPDAPAKITPKPYLYGAVALVFDVDDKSLAFFTFDDGIDKLHVVRHGIMGKEMVFTKPKPAFASDVYIDQAILAPLGSPSGFDFGGRWGYPNLIHAVAITNLFDYGSQTARKTVRGLNVEYVALRDEGYEDASETSFEIRYVSDQDTTPHGYNTAVAHFTGMNIASNTAFKCTFGVRGKYIRHAYVYEGPSGLTIYRECETVRLDGSSSSGEIEGLAQGTPPVYN
jgi:hypothetical protein